MRYFGDIIILQPQILYMSNRNFYSIKGKIFYGEINGEFVTDFRTFQCHPRKLCFLELVRDTDYILFENRVLLPLNSPELDVNSCSIRFIGSYAVALKIQARMSPIEALPETKEIILTNVQLIISALDFNIAKKWRFRFHGKEISAHIKDPTFQKKVTAGDTFTIGDKLIVSMLVKQRYEKFKKIYIDEFFEILHVFDHTDYNGKTKWGLLQK